MLATHSTPDFNSGHSFVNEWTTAKTQKGISAKIGEQTVGSVKNLGKPKSHVFSNKLFS